MTGTTHADKIINALRAEARPMVKADLDAKTKIPYAIMGATLNHMLRYGAIIRPARGVYALAKTAPSAPAALDAALYQLILELEQQTPPVACSSLKGLHRMLAERLGPLTREEVTRALDRLAAAGRVRANHFILSGPRRGELTFGRADQYDPPGWPLPGATHPEGAVIDWRPRPPPHLTKEQAAAELARYAPKFPTAARLDELLWPAPQIPKWARHCVRGPAGLEALLA